MSTFFSHRPVGLLLWCCVGCTCAHACAPRLFTVTFFSSQTPEWFQIKFHRDVPGVNLYHIPSKNFDFLKNIGLWARLICRLWYIMKALRISCSETSHLILTKFHMKVPLINLYQMPARNSDPLEIMTFSCS